MRGWRLYGPYAGGLGSGAVGLLIVVLVILIVICAAVWWYLRRL